MTAFLPRLAFGFDNPNKAAVLLGCLALVGLAGALRFRRTSSVLAGVFSAAALFGLALTASRGGLLAFCCGAVPILAVNRRVLKGRHLVVILLVAAAALGLFLNCGNPQRLRPDLAASDRSVVNRLLIWRCAPSLMADAPRGWGLGNAGAAYRSWYQPLDRHEDYRTLVCSHLTWLVEFGRGGRLAYAAAWLFVLALGALHLRLRHDALPLAVWLCLGVAAQFSSVGETALLWLVPSALLIAPLATFCSCEAAPLRRACLAVALLGGTALVAGLEAVGRNWRPSGLMSIANDGSRLVVGSGRPTRWIVLDASVMGGEAYGRRLRAYAANRSGEAFGVAFALDGVPADVEQLAVCGDVCPSPERLASFGRLRALRVLSPRNPNVPCGAKALDIQAFVGEFAAGAPSDERAGLTVVPGCGTYLPDWPVYAFD